MSNHSLSEIIEYKFSHPEVGERTLIPNIKNKNFLLLLWSTPFLWLLRTGEDLNESSTFFFFPHSHFWVMSIQQFEFSYYLKLFFNSLTYSFNIYRICVTGQDLWIGIERYRRKVTQTYFYSCGCHMISDI